MYREISFEHLYNSQEINLIVSSTETYRLIEIG